MREDLLRETEAELEDLRRRNEQEEIARKTAILSSEPEIAALLTRREQLIRGESTAASPLPEE